MNRLKQKYQDEIVPALKKEWNFAADLAVPRVTKIVINLGIKEGAGDKGVAQKIQQAVITRAHQAEAGFNLRKGDTIGVMATLRGERMYAFLDKLVHLVLPQLRDFQGVSLNSFDGRGNYSLGLAEQIVFPEVDYDTIDQIRGLQLTIVTNTNDNKQAHRLLELLGMPFAKPESDTKT